MSVMRVIGICAAFVFIFFFVGGPLIGLAVASTTFLIPSVLIVVILALALWKIGDLARR